MRDETELGEEYYWAITQAEGRYGCTIQVPLCWSWDLNWTLTSVHKQTLSQCLFMYMYKHCICIHKGNQLQSKPQHTGT